MPLRAPVAQLDRALACGAKGRKFESCQVYQDKAPYFCRGFCLGSERWLRTILPSVSP